MSAAVSYASVGESPVDSTPASATPEPTTNESSSIDQTQLPSPKQSPVPSKQVSLAPAPIPETNAWGDVSVSSAVSSRSNSNIDAKFWPSASEIDLTQQPNVSSSRKINFKNTAEKWVPFKGAVIVQSQGQSQSQSQNKKSSQKRNNKNNSNSNNSTNNSNPSTKSNDKKKRNKSDKRQQQQQQQQQQQNQTQTVEKNQQPVDKVQSEQEQQSVENQEQPAQENKSQQEQTSEEQQQQQTNGQQQQTSQSQQQNQGEGKEHQPRHFKQNQQFQPQHGAPTYQGHPQFQGQPQQRPPFRQYNNNNNRRFNNNNRYNNGSQRHNNNNFNGPFVPYQQRRHQNHPMHVPYTNGYIPVSFPFNQSIQLNRNEEPLFSIIKQIEYYFSVENLIKDFYLRKQMNNEGWLPVKVIAAFKRLSILSAGDLSLVKRSIDELNDLGLLEVGEFNNNVLKVRVKENWSNWVLPVEQRDASGQEDSELINLVPSKAVESTESTESATPVVAATEEITEEAKEVEAST